MLLADLVSAFMLLTRLPVARFARPPDFGRCVWAFPLVGLVVNGIGGVIDWLANSAGVPPLLAAAWSLAAMTVITGGLHDDGLADTADGFGGGTTRARKLEIMRDSRIGSYGTLALVLSMIARTAAISALARPVPDLIVAGMLGRGGILLLLWLLAPARGDGMAASVGTPPLISVAGGLGLAVAAAALCLPALTAVEAVGLGCGCSLVLATLAATQIGGHTGDVLGAAEVASECVVLTVLATAR